MAQDRVEAVERALSVLEAFDSDQHAFSLAELAQATGYYKSTLLRLLGSLARFDYVRRDEAGLWHLGESPRRLARRQDPHRLLAARVQPLLDDLAARLDETASLLERTRDGIECRLVALPNATLRHDLRPGMAWSPADEEPCPELAGGRMVAHPMPITPGAPRRWLAISGPEGRLPVADATLALAEAIAWLETRRHDTPVPEATP